MELAQAPILDEAEGRNGLAGCYLNRSDAAVRSIHMDPSASGQFRVIIMLDLEMEDNNIGSARAPTLDEERKRRLAGHYRSQPGAHVSQIYIEARPFG